MKRPMRVLITADAVGGVWQYSLDLARGLAQHKIETVLVVLGPSPTPAQVRNATAIPRLTLVQTDLPLDWLAANRTSVRKAGEAVAALAAKHGVDVVQLNAPALCADVEFDVPVVAAAHSCVATWWHAVKKEKMPRLFSWRSELAARGMRAADLVVAPTAAFARATQVAHDLDVVPTTVHNGRSRLPLPRVASHDFAFTAGRLWDKGKNAATLDRAAGLLPVPFQMAGPTHGPNGDSIELEHAHHVGNLSECEMARWLAAKPVFVSAALYEPFGLAILEAAFAGCALVLSDIPTFRELWDGAAIFVDPMDHAGFAAQIGDIVGDDLVRAQLGRAAAKRAERYTVTAMADKMAALYRRVAKTGAAQVAA